MSEFVFDLATPADDADLQRLLRDNPVPGRVTIGYERSPSYFDGCPVMGPVCQTLIARHRPSGKVAGLASRSVRPLYVNGQAQQIGYLGQLRVDHRFRSRWLVTGGFKLLRRLHGDRLTDGYLTTIIDGNSEAEGVLVQRPRPGFPVYRPIDKLHTLAIRPVRQRRHPAAVATIRAATAEDRPAVIAFLRRYGARRNFFPVPSDDDLLPHTPATRGLAIGDVLLAERCGELHGVIALWDQSAYKQAIVRGYSPLWRWGRPLYNAWAHTLGGAPLPAIGEGIRLATAAFPCIADDNPAVFFLLLQQLSALAADRGYTRLMLGLTGRDPLLAVARRFPHVVYSSTLYSVSWPEEIGLHEQLDNRIIHLEIATL